ASDGVELEVWRAPELALEVIRHDGARFDLDGLSPDPSAGLREDRDAARSRLRDVEEARSGVRSDLDRDTVLLRERTERKSSVETGLEKQRHQLGDARDRVTRLDAEHAASDAYRRACESTVPAVLRRDPSGLLDRFLFAVLPIFFSRDLANWKIAVRRHQTLEDAREAARADAVGAEDQLARLRRERVALMNETVRLNHAVGRLEGELGALGAEHDAVRERLEAVEEALRAVPDARRKDWEDHLLAHGASSSTRRLRLAGPGGRLPSGVVLCVGAHVEADTILLLPGASDPEPLAELGVAMRLRDDVGAGGKTGNGPPAADGSVAPPAADADRFQVVASRAAVRSIGLALAAEGEQLADRLRDVVDAARKKAATRAEEISQLTARWSDAFVAETVARSADARVSIAESLAHDVAASVPSDLSDAWQGIGEPLRELDDAHALRDASEGLAAHLQARVDAAHHGAVGRLGAGAAAWIDEQLALRLRSEAEALEALDVAVPPPPHVDTIDVTDVMRDVRVADGVGRIGGPLLTLRAAADLRSEAIMSVRAATEQAVIQLQARLVGGSAALAVLLETNLRTGLEAGRSQLLAAAADAGTPARIAAETASLRDIEEAVLRLRGHAASLADAAGDIGLS
ncbi:MAG: hypothetical protein VX000_00820, partial [Myxococcota bacterium]|nr:hypothetical protein [Myxococcota bacterium]